MADYYGACTGKAGGKYNLWLSVTQNYQSIGNNVSNVSVALYLKRNDGYSDSAYNLNDWDNSASITINGETKVWRNLDIDTRGNVTVTLAEWTGDVYHNADGSLSLSVEGSFIMGNNNLTGGQASTVFNCTFIPRTSYMTLSTTEIYPGGSIACNVVSASSEFSHSINFYLEQIEGGVWLSEGITTGYFTVPVDWVSQLPWSSSANISVVLTTYYYGQYVGSNTYSVRLVIPDTNEFKPTFDIVVEKIDNGVPADWNLFLKGISGVKVDVANLNLKYGAVVVACEARVGNSTYNGVPSWFYLLDSGNVEISVFIRDSRGLTYTASTTVYVMDYFAPSLVVNSIKRCNAQGDLTESGEYFLLDYNTNLCSVDGKNVMRVSYRCGTSSDDWGEEIFINNSPAIIGNGIVVPSRSYVVRLCIYDSVNWWGITIDRSVPSADIPFNIRKGGKGAAFGCYAEKDNELTVGWDLNIKGKIKSDDSLLTLSNEISYITDYSKVRNYPSLNTCFVNLGFIASVDIPEGVYFVVGYSKVKPIDFSPLSTIVWGYKPGQAYIDSHTNAIIFRSSEYIPAGVGIYINGSYTTNKEE
jgi:hypothetical protein